MKVGLYFGSFNPIHIGHLIVADAVLNEAKLSQVWFVISPQNPFKKSQDLLHEFDRFDLVEKATASNSRFKAVDIEFHLPKPSYTIDTLQALHAKHPDVEFSLIMGADNWLSFNRWKDYKKIIELVNILVYPRNKVAFETSNLPWLNSPEKVTLVDAPELDISATYIRNRLKAGKSVQYLLPDGLDTYIQLKKFYQ